MDAVSGGVVVSTWTCVHEGHAIPLDDLWAVINRATGAAVCNAHHDDAPDPATAQAWRQSHEGQRVPVVQRTKCDQCGHEGPLSEFEWWFGPALKGGADLGGICFGCANDQRSGMEADDMVEQMRSQD